MRRATIFLAMSFAAVPAAAQTPPSQANAGGTATVQSHMKSLGYRNIHDLRQTPDGQWTGKATQNGIERNVTVQPNGATTAR